MFVLYRARQCSTFGCTFLPSCFIYKVIAVGQHAPAIYNKRALELLLAMFFKGQNNQRQCVKRCRKPTLSDGLAQGLSSARWHSLDLKVGKDQEIREKAMSSS